MAITGSAYKALSCRCYQCCNLGTQNRNPAADNLGAYINQKGSLLFTVKNVAGLLAPVVF